MDKLKRYFVLQITNNKNKKHLFSDTDTETRGDDCKTDISWLRESNRKPKAQLIDYSRNKHLGKPINTDKSEKLFLYFLRMLQ